MRRPQAQSPPINAWFTLPPIVLLIQETGPFPPLRHEPRRPSQVQSLARPQGDDGLWPGQHESASPRIIAIAGRAERQAFPAALGWLPFDRSSHFAVLEDESNLISPGRGEPAIFECTADAALDVA